MQFLVICRPTPGGDPEEFKRLLPSETSALRDLKANGTLTAAWNPGHPGVILMLEAADDAEAARHTAAFPLAQAGQITTEVIPLHPIDL